MKGVGLQYRITGADRDTGLDREILIEASDEQSAVRAANARGILVAEVELAEDAESVDAMNPASLVVGEYDFYLQGESLTINGPNPGLAQLLGPRLMHLAQVPEGQLVLGRPEVLTDVFHIPSEPNLKTASPKQIAYARNLGFAVADDISRDEIAFLLTDFEEVRFYVYFVFRAIFGAAPSDVGVDTASINRIVMRLFEDAPLAVRIVALKALANAEGETPEIGGDVYDKVFRMVRRLK